MLPLEVSSQDVAAVLSNAHRIRRDEDRIEKEGQTDRHTDRQTEIEAFRALHLIIVESSRM